MIIEVKVATFLGKSQQAQEVLKPKVESEVGFPAGRNVVTMLEKPSGFESEVVTKGSNILPPGRNNSEGVSKLIQRLKETTDFSR